MTLQVIYLPVLIPEGALGNLSCKSFSFDHWYCVCTNDWCDIPICASTTLAYPLIPPVALALADTDVRRGCAEELMNSSALLEILSKGGRYSRGRRAQSLCKGWAPTERKTQGTWAVWQSRSESVQSSLHSWAPFIILKAFFFPLVGRLVVLLSDHLPNRK